MQSYNLKNKSGALVKVLGIHPDSIFALIQYTTGEISVYSLLDLSECNSHKLVSEQIAHAPRVKFDIIG